MLHANEIYGGDSDYPCQIIDTVTLDFENRRRRRLKLTGDNGIIFLLDLPEVRTLRDGDVLLLSDGNGVVIRAKDEAIVDITCRDIGHLVRIAWHLGNRHLPTQLFEDRLRIRQDHVIEEMVVKLGATTSRLDAPFNPEGGAYGHGETYGHSHASGSVEDHSHG